MVTHVPQDFVIAHAIPSHLLCCVGYNSNLAVSSCITLCIENVEWILAEVDVECGASGCDKGCEL